MEISNELLAAYAEGNVSESERDVVRQYLMENPDELESVLMMMDEDYDIQLEDREDSSTPYSFDKELAVPSLFKYFFIISFFTSSEYLLNFCPFLAI